MDHNFYHRHEERLAEIRREVEHLRLLKAAGLSGPGWVARAGKAVSNWLAMRITRQQVDDMIDNRSYQKRSDGLPQ